MGAGVLPIAFHNGKVYMLIGKENHSGGWSDFGGGREKDESLYETAIREGVEELNGFFGGETILRNKIKNNSITVLETKEPVYKCYLFKVDYDKNLPEYFNQNFKLMKKRLPSVVEKHNGLFEKSEVRWVTLSELKKMKMRKFFYLAVYPLLNNFLSNYSV